MTTSSVSGTANAAGWVRAASATVTLSSTDAGGSGVASITYKIGSASAVTANSATANFTISSQGSTTVTYFATDAAGNVEKTKSVTVKLDNVAPSVAGTFPIDGTSYSSQTEWGTNCRNVSNTAVAAICGTDSDATSGGVSVQYEVRRSIWLLGDQCWNGTKWASCTGDDLDTDSGPGATNWLIPMTWSQRGYLGIFASYAVTIQVTDAADNVTTSEVMDFG